jgi:hypothetical protein
LLGRALTKFRQESEQGSGGDGADAGSGGEQPARLLELWGAGDQRGDLRLQGFDRRIEPGQMLGDAVERDRIGAFMPTGAFLLAGGDQLVAALVKQRERSRARGRD